MPTIINFKRDITTGFSSLLTQFSCILLTGPRQVGKTRFLKDNFASNYTYVTLDDFNVRSIAKNNTSQFLTIYEPPIIIDEIQYAPELFSYIKILIDNGAPAGSFILTGSQVFSLMELAGESLAGRVAIVTMPFLSAHEIYGKNENIPFDIDIKIIKNKINNSSNCDTLEMNNRIFNGSMPALLSHKISDRNIFYESYIETYINRDICDLVPRIDKLTFRDFLTSIACVDSQLLNLHTIASNLNISNDTAKRWLNLLLTTGMVYYLHPFSNNNLKRTVKTKKIYFNDTGLVCYLLGLHNVTELSDNPNIGMLFENYVINEIKNSFTNSLIHRDIYFFRNDVGKEVDLIIRNGISIDLVEIKHSFSPTIKYKNNFEVFKNSNVRNKAVICNTDSLHIVDDNIYMIPAYCI